MTGSPRRRWTSTFKAPYITIAAAKPFSGTIGQFFEQQSKNVKGAEFSFHSSSLIGKAKQLIERHVNNTEPEFFFLPKSGHPSIPEDIVVFLRLTIALRKEHYDTLAEAKIAELADVFQAKLGWLKGNIYSRVATPDLEDRGLNAAEIKAGFYDQYIPRDKTVWLSALQAELLRKIVNGIAQGFATDAIRAHLRARGFTEALVDLGETAALGGPYRLALEDPAFGRLGQLSLTDTAIATSSPAALRLGAETHILAPDGRPPLWSTICIEAASATLADALSTAAVFLPRPALVRLKIAAGLRRIAAIGPDGDLTTV